VLTCGGSIRAVVDDYVLNQMHSGFKKLRTAEDPSGPQLLKNGKKQGCFHP
jgi:hypothetical protein